MATQHVGLPVRFTVAPGPDGKPWVHMTHDYPGATFVWGLPAHIAAETIDAYAQMVKDIAAEAMREGNGLAVVSDPATVHQFNRTAEAARRAKRR